MSYHLLVAKQTQRAWQKGDYSPLANAAFPLVTELATLMLLLTFSLISEPGLGLQTIIAN